MLSLGIGIRWTHPVASFLCNSRWSYVGVWGTCLANFPCCVIPNGLEQRGEVVWQSHSDLHNFRWTESCVGSTMFPLVTSPADEHVGSYYNLAVLNDTSNG